MWQQMMAGGIRSVLLGKTAMGLSSYTKMQCRGSPAQTSQTGYTIKGGGTLMVGQEQDICGDDFDASQSVQGSIANLNLWSCVLPAETISEMYQSCYRGEGDVLKWSDFKHNVQGDTEVVVPNPCIS